MIKIDLSISPGTAPDNYFSPAMAMYQPMASPHHHTPDSGFTPFHTPSSSGYQSLPQQAPVPPSPSPASAGYIPLSHPLPPHIGAVPMSAHQGISTRDFVLRLCAMNPSLVPLVIVVKQFLQVTCLFMSIPSLMWCVDRRRAFTILSPGDCPHTL